MEEHLFQTLNIVSCFQESLESPFPQLVALESSSIDFVNDLECLDRLSPRSADSVHVFYMKSGQKGADEILNNVVSLISILLYITTVFCHWPIWDRIWI